MIFCRLDTVGRLCRPSANKNFSSEFTNRPIFVVRLVPADKTFPNTTEKIFRRSSVSGCWLNRLFRKWRQIRQTRTVIISVYQFVYEQCRRFCGIRPTSYRNRDEKERKIFEEITESAIDCVNVKNRQIFSRSIFVGRQCL